MSFLKNLDDAARGKKKRINLNMTESIWKDARKVAIDEDISFSQYIEKLVEKDLKRRAKK